MLSDIDIDNLIKPFTDRSKVIEDYIVKIIAQRIKEIGTMKPSDIRKLERLYKTGSDVKAINEEIARITGPQVKDIKKLIKEVAADSYADAKPYYDYRHIAQIPLSQNVELQNVIVATALQTQKTFKNLSNSKMLGFVIRDMKKPKKLKFYTAEETYKSVVDEAIQAAQSGVIDYNTAMRRTLKQLNSSGLRKIYWDSGYTQRADSAIQRNILDGIRQINQWIHILTGKKFGADGYELTAHHAPAPDHAPFQGHMFTERQFKRLQKNKSFKDINGNHFPAQRRIIGQWNCKHFAYPIIIGVSHPKYTDEELQDILDENEKGVTLPNGKHVTLYELTQIQNAKALKVRQMKDGQIMAKEAGNMELAKEYQAKVNKYTKEYNAFNKYVGEQANISSRPDKLTVSGYKKISTK